MSAVRSNPTRNRAGYTLVEVLIVVAILGIASAMIVPHMLSAGTLGVQAAARIIVADILYAQNDAIARQGVRKVVFDPATESYALTDESDSILSVRWKNGSSNNYIVDFTTDDRFQGVEIVSADFNGTSTLEFDALGGPSNGGTVVIEYQGEQYRVTVAAFTGRVTVERI